MIDLYILETCPYCKKVMDYMDANKIPYNKIDTKDYQNALKLLNQGGKDQVPFIHDKENNAKFYESDEIIAYLKNRIRHEQ